MSPHPQPQSQTPPPAQSSAAPPPTPCSAVTTLAGHLHFPLVPPANGNSNDATGCCTWHGVTCSLGSGAPAVKSIAWPRQSLQGNLSTLVPETWSPLAASLETLDLAGNPLLIGSLPASALAQLTSLRSLSLANTGLSGPLLPNTLPASLQALDLSSTSLSGAIPSLPRSISACNLAPGANANYTCFSQPIPSACRNSLPATLTECPAPGPFDNFQWTSDVVILIAAAIVVTFALISMIVMCYRWDRARDQATLEKDQLLGELRRIRVQQASAQGTDPALEALGPQMARAAMVAAQKKRSSMASSSAGADESTATASSTPGDPRASFTPSSTGAGAADPRFSFASAAEATAAQGMRVSYDPYDPRWSYPSTPGSAAAAVAFNPHALQQYQHPRASYVSSASSAYPVSPSTALWPPATAAAASDIIPSPATRQSWPVYPPPSSSSSASPSSPSPARHPPWTASPAASARSSNDGARGLGSSYGPDAATVAAISRPPLITADLAATRIDATVHAPHSSSHPPTTRQEHPEAGLPPPKRQSMLSVFRSVLVVGAKWKRLHRMSAPPAAASPVLVTTQPLKSHDDREDERDNVGGSERPASWIGARSILPPSVIEYRALDTLEHSGGGASAVAGEGHGQAQYDPTLASSSLAGGAPASMVAQYPRSEAEHLLLSTDAAATCVPPSASAAAAGSSRGPPAEDLNSFRWLPSADHRLSASMAPPAGEEQAAGGMVVLNPVRQNSGESYPPPPPLEQQRQQNQDDSPLAGHAVPSRLAMMDVVTLGDVLSEAGAGVGGGVGGWVEGKGAGGGRGARG